MSGYISEFFGQRSEDNSNQAQLSVIKQLCPFTSKPCSKILARDRIISGVCAVRQKTENSPDVICCPIRIYAEDYKVLKEVSRKAFSCELNLYSGRAAISKAKLEGGAIAVFGHGWGGELRLPQRQGQGAYFVDWVLARLDKNGDLVEFTAIEVQTIDTTGNYRKAREGLLHGRNIIPDTVGLNWENVSKGR